MTWLDPEEADKHRNTAYYIETFLYMNSCNEKENSQLYESFSALEEQ